MVNEEKVRLMTKIASFEKKEGKKNIKESGSYKSDYIRSHILKTIWSYTAAYVLILFMIFMYHLEYFLKYAVELDYKKIGMEMLFVYLLIVVGCMVIGFLGFSRLYEKKRHRLKKYYGDLKQLEHFYEENRKETTDDTSASV